MTGLSIAKSLELHLLQPLATRDDVAAGCERARELHLAAVVVAPSHVRVAVETCRDSDVRVCAAIGFPSGHDVIETKLRAVEIAASHGADEISVVLDQSLLAGGDISAARRELAALLASSYWSSLTSTRGTGLLTMVVESQLIDLRQLEPLLADLADSPAQFVQSATGSQPRLETDDHIRALRAVTPPDIGIKAVGGIVSCADANSLINAGATRVGSSAATAIAAEEHALRHVRSNP